MFGFIWVIGFVEGLFVINEFLLFSFPHFLAIHQPICSAWRFLLLESTWDESEKERERIINTTQRFKRSSLYLISNHPASLPAQFEQHTFIPSIAENVIRKSVIASRQATRKLLKDSISIAEHTCERISTLRKFLKAKRATFQIDW